MDDSKFSFLIPAWGKKNKPRVLQIIKIKNYGNVENILLKVCKTINSASVSGSELMDGTILVYNFN